MRVQPHGEAGAPGEVGHDASQLGAVGFRPTRRLANTFSAPAAIGAGGQELLHLALSAFRDVA